MTREHKLALVVGFGLVLFVGILIADHVAADRRAHLQGPAAVLRESMSKDLFRAPNRPTIDLAVITAPSDPPIIDEEPVVRFAPREDRSHLARPNRPRADEPSVRENTRREYRVRPGDSLGKIARMELGRESRWNEIAELNGLKGSTIRPGQRLLLPSRESNRSPRLREVASEPARPAVPRTYTVRPGDSLSGIAQRELGRESQWSAIKDLNGLKTSMISPGQKLRLPED